MGIISTKVFGLFEEYRSRKFIFIKPVGNWGDSLIFKGAEKLADLAGLDYRSVSCADFMGMDFSQDHVLYVFGNGGFNDIWNGEHVRAFSKAMATHAGIVILGPTSFHPDFWRANAPSIFSAIKADQVYIFSRGLISSLSILDAIPESVVRRMDHDTALNLERSDLVAKEKKGSGILYAIRQDKESVKFSKFHPFVLWLDPVEFSRNFEEWLRIHDGVEEIITNRLHSAVLGMILNKKVTLLPNSYDKNRRVWELSLQQRGVQWRDELPLPGFSKHLIQHDIYRRLSNSYKISRLVNSSYVGSLS